MFFHFVNALYKKIKGEPLHSRFQSDGDFRRVIKLFSILPLFQEKEIKEILEKIKKEYVDKNDKEVTIFYQYFVDTWVNKIKINNWMCFNSTHRTNNIAESFHSFLVRKIPNIHPYFDVFVDYLKEVMKEVKLKFEIEKFNPKTRLPKVGPINKVVNLINNYYNDPIMNLGLNELIDELMTILFSELLNEAELGNDNNDEQQSMSEDGSDDDEYLALDNEEISNKENSNDQIGLMECEQSIYQLNNQQMDIEENQISNQLDEQQQPMDMMIHQLTNEHRIYQQMDIINMETSNHHEEHQQPIASSSDEQNIIRTNQKSKLETRKVIKPKKCSKKRTLKQKKFIDDRSYDQLSYESSSTYESSSSDDGFDYLQFTTKKKISKRNKK